MTSYQNALDYAMDQMNVNNITADEANVMIVQMMGIRVVDKLRRDVRKALNEAVKRGELGHVKKKGLRPEIYHHKNARALALQEQDRIEKEAKETLTKIYSV